MRVSTIIKKLIQKKPSKTGPWKDRIPSRLLILPHEFLSELEIVDCIKVELDSEKKIIVLSKP